MKIQSRLQFLSSHESGEKYDHSRLNTFSLNDNEPLIATYDCETPLDKSILFDRPFDMWRYKEMLPVEEEINCINLGEGGTPLLPFSRLASKLGMDKLWCKDEGQNPTGSFKARGLAMAVSKAKELGVQEMAIPTAGNAGSALSAYCAKAGINAHIFMPKATPEVFQLDCKVMGANVHIVDGNISDCGKLMREKNKEGKWFDVTTLKEPYRLEGKKTMGYEIAEQMGWQVPDVIIYPTGGGTGLIGIWRAFMEMKALGWIKNVPTKMIAVQVDSCNPIVTAFTNHQSYSTPYQNPGVTIANGLRVPHAFGHKLIMKTLYESGGSALSVSDQEMLTGISEVAQAEGLFLSPEGAATYIALNKLLQSNVISSSDSVVLLNTGSAYKYVENLL